MTDLENTSKSSPNTVSVKNGGEAKKLSGNKTLTGKQPSKTRERIKSINPVILAGGLGTRLRPLTHANMPKPFLKLFSDQTLLQETVKRVSYLGDPVVICNEKFEERARKQVREIGKTAQVIAEPFNKSTAPAIAIAAFALEAANKPMLVMPSDHYIEDPISFQKTIDDALDRLKSDNLVMLGASAIGIDEQRYGYILSNATGDVKGFREKPNTAESKKLRTRGHCMLNTGIFLVRPRHYLNLLSEHAPETFAATRKAFDTSIVNYNQVVINAAEYQNVPSESVDYAIMEKVHNAQVISLNTYWSDIGTWRSVLALKMNIMFGNRAKAA